MDAEDIGDIELKHTQMGDQLGSVVDMYREALNTMQNDVQQVVGGLFGILKRQLEEIETKSKGKFQSTQHRIKLLRSLHKNMVEMEQAFEELKQRYPDVTSGAHGDAADTEFINPTESTDSVDREF